MAEKGKKEEAVGGNRISDEEIEAILRIRLPTLNRFLANLIANNDPTNNENIFKIRTVRDLLTIRARRDKISDRHLASTIKWLELFCDRVDKDERNAASKTKSVNSPKSSSDNKNQPSTIRAPQSSSNNRNQPSTSRAPPSSSNNRNQPSTSRGAAGFAPPTPNKKGYKTEEVYVISSSDEEDNDISYVASYERVTNTATNNTPNTLIPSSNKLSDSNKKENLENVKIETDSAVVKIEENNVEETNIVKEKPAAECVSKKLEEGELCDEDEVAVNSSSDIQNQDSVVRDSDSSETVIENSSGVMQDDVSEERVRNAKSASDQVDIGENDEIRSSLTNAVQETTKKDHLCEKSVTNEKEDSKTTEEIPSTPSCENSDSSEKEDSKTVEETPSTPSCENSDSSEKEDSKTVEETPSTPSCEKSETSKKEDSKPSEETPSTPSGEKSDASEKEDSITAEEAPTPCEKPETSEKEDSKTTEEIPSTPSCENSDSSEKEDSKTVEETPSTPSCENSDSSEKEDSKTVEETPSTPSCEKSETSKKEDSKPSEETPSAPSCEKSNASEKENSKTAEETPSYEKSDTSEKEDSKTTEKILSTHEKTNDNQDDKTTQSFSSIKNDETNNQPSTSYAQIDDNTISNEVTHQIATLNKEKDDITKESSKQSTQNTDLVPSDTENIMESSIKIESQGLSYSELEQEQILSDSKKQNSIPDHISLCSEILEDYEKLEFPDSPFDNSFESFDLKNENGDLNVESVNDDHNQVDHKIQSSNNETETTIQNNKDETSDASEEIKTNSSSVPIDKNIEEEEASDLHKADGSLSSFLNGTELASTSSSEIPEKPVEENKKQEYPASECQNDVVDDDDKLKSSSKHGDDNVNRKQDSHQLTDKKNKKECKESTSSSVGEEKHDSDTAKKDPKKNFDKNLKDKPLLNNSQNPKSKDIDTKNSAVTKDNKEEHKETKPAKTSTSVGEEKHDSDTAKKDPKKNFDKNLKDKPLLNNSQNPKSKDIDTKNSAVTKDNKEEHKETNPAKTSTSVGEKKHDSETAKKDPKKNFDKNLKDSKDKPLLNNSQNPKSKDIDTKNSAVTKDNKEEHKESNPAKTSTSVGEEKHDSDTAKKDPKKNFDKNLKDIDTKKPAVTKPVAQNKLDTKKASESIKNTKQKTGIRDQSKMLKDSPIIPINKLEANNVTARSSDKILNDNNDKFCKKSVNESEDFFNLSKNVENTNESSTTDVVIIRDTLSKSPKKLDKIITSNTVAKNLNSKVSVDKSNSSLSSNDSLSKDRTNDDNNKYKIPKKNSSNAIAKNILAEETTSRVTSPKKSDSSQVLKEYDSDKNVENSIIIETNLDLNKENKSINQADLNRQQSINEMNTIKVNILPRRTPSATSISKENSNPTKQVEQSDFSDYLYLDLDEQEKSILDPSQTSQIDFTEPFSDEELQFIDDDNEKYDNDDVNQKNKQLLKSDKDNEASAQRDKSPSLNDNGLSEKPDKYTKLIYSLDLNSESSDGGISDKSDGIIKSSFKIIHNLGQGFEDDESFFLNSNKPDTKKNEIKKTPPKSLTYDKKNIHKWHRDKHSPPSSPESNSNNSSSCVDRLPVTIPKPACQPLDPLAWRYDDYESQNKWHGKWKNDRDSSDSAVSLKNLNCNIDSYNKRLRKYNKQKTKSKKPSECDENESPPSAAAGKEEKRRHKSHKKKRSRSRRSKNNHRNRDADTESDYYSNDNYRSDCSYSSRNRYKTYSHNKKERMSSPYDPEDIFDFSKPIKENSTKTKERLVNHYSNEDKTASTSNYKYTAADDDVIWRSSKYSLPKPKESVTKHIPIIDLDDDDDDEDLLKNTSLIDSDRTSTSHIPGILDEFNTRNEEKIEENITKKKNDDKNEHIQKNSSHEVIRTSAADRINPVNDHHSYIVHQEEPHKNNCAKDIPKKVASSNDRPAHTTEETKITVNVTVDDITNLANKSLSELEKIMETMEKEMGLKPLRDFILRSEQEPQQEDCNAPAILSETTFQNSNLHVPPPENSFISPHQEVLLPQEVLLHQDVHLPPHPVHPPPQMAIESQQYMNFNQYNNIEPYTQYARPVDPPGYYGYPQQQMQMPPRQPPPATIRANDPRLCSRLNLQAQKFRSSDQQVQSQSSSQVVPIPLPVINPRMESIIQNEIQSECLENISQQLPGAYQDPPVNITNQNITKATLTYGEYRRRRDELDAEIKRRKEAQIQRVKEAELQRLKEAELDAEIKRRKEAQVQRAKEAEIQRLKDVELEAEIKRRKEAQIQRVKEAEIQRLKDAELEARKKQEDDAKSRMALKTTEIPKKKDVTKVNSIKVCNKIKSTKDDGLKISTKSRKEDALKICNKIKSPKHEGSKVYSKTKSTKEERVKEHGKTKSTKEEGVEVHGKAKSTKEERVEVHGKTKSTKEERVEVHGKTKSTKQEGIEVHGKTKSTKEEGIEVHGKTKSTKEEGIEVHGKTKSTKEEGVEVHGKAKSTKEERVEVHGKTKSTKEERVEVHGKTKSTKQEGIEVHGKTKSTKEERVEVHGKTKSTKEECIEVHGKTKSTKEESIKDNKTKSLSPDKDDKKSTQKNPSSSDSDFDSPIKIRSLKRRPSRPLCLESDTSDDSTSLPTMNTVKKKLILTPNKELTVNENVISPTKSVISPSKVEDTVSLDREESAKACKTGPTEDQMKIILNVLEKEMRPDQFKTVKHILIGEKIEQNTPELSDINVSSQCEVQNTEETPSLSTPSKAAAPEATTVGAISSTQTSSNDVVINKRKPGSFELEKLYPDIYKMYNRDGGINASGRRTSATIAACKIAKQKSGKRKNENRKASRSDSSDSDWEDTKKKMKRRKSCQTDLPNKTKISSEEDNTRKRHIADADDDTDDYSEHVREVLSKQNTKTSNNDSWRCIPATDRKPVVKLTRLPPDIEETVKPTSDITDDNELLKPLKVIKEPSAAKLKKQRVKSKSKQIKNNNINYHTKSKDYNNCLICKKTFSNIVDHYVNSHLYDEVMCSRLPIEDIESLKNTPLKATRIPDTNKYSGMCIFCNKEITDTFVNFNEHYTTHTGEFAFECSECDVQKSSKRDILFHCKKQCKSKDTAKHLKLYTYKDDTKISAFVCTFCNYIQLHEPHITMHLKNHHLLKIVKAEDFMEVILSRMPEEEEKSTERNEIDNIAVVNEPVTVKSEEAEIILQITTSSYTDIGPCTTNVDCKDEMEASFEDMDIETLLENMGAMCDDSITIDDKTLVPRDPTMTVVHCQNSTNNAESSTQDTIDQILQNTKQKMANSEPDTAEASFECTDIVEEKPVISDMTEQFPVQQENLEVNNTVSEDIKPNPIELDALLTPTVPSKPEGETPMEVTEEPPVKVPESATKLTTKEVLINDGKPDDIGNLDRDKDSFEKIKQIGSDKITQKLAQLLNGKCDSIPTDQPIVNSSDEANYEVIELEDDDDLNQLQNESDETLSADSSEHADEYDLVMPTGSQEITRVMNIGYQKNTNKIQYYCLVEKCRFLSTNDVNELRAHLREHTRKWSGKCNICQKRVYNETKIPLEHELHHLIEVHLKDDNHDDDNEEIGQQNKRMRISTEYLHVINNLKPWLLSTISEKSEILCQEIRSNLNLFALYKCLGNDCAFATSSQSGFLYHLKKHNEKMATQLSWIPSPSIIKRPWQECCYCADIYSEPEKLLTHINEVHSSSIFQCSKCFYRSCATNNVKIHQQVIHNVNDTKDIAIFICHGKPKAFKSEIFDILEHRDKYIKPLQCPGCDKKYFVKKHLMEHIRQSHKSKCNIKNLNFGIFACLYCELETNAIQEIRQHMANNHPTKLLYVCARYLNTEKIHAQVDPSSVKSTSLMYIGELVQKELLKKCPYDIAQLCISEAPMQQLPNLNDDYIFYEPHCDVYKGLPPSTRQQQQLPESIAVNVIDFDQLKNCLEDDFGDIKGISKNNRNGLNNNEVATELLKAINMVVQNTGLSGKKLYICSQPNCTLSFKAYKGWKKHFRSTHPDITNTTLQPCPHCDDTYQIQEFANHFISHEMHRYFCYFCGETFLCCMSAEKHLRSKHSYINSRIINLLDTATITTTDSSCQQKYYVITADALHGDIESLMKHMIDVLKLKYRNRNSQTISKLNNNSKKTVDLCLSEQAKHLTKDNYHQQAIISLDNNDNIDDKIPKFIKDSKRFICGYKYCMFRGRTETHLESHLKEMHARSGGIYTCPHCSSQIKYSKQFSNIRDHLRLHSGILFVCYNCSHVNCSRAGLTRHLNQCHKDIDDCIVINYVRAEAIIKKQIEIVHNSSSTPSSDVVSLNNNDNIKCLLCDVRFLNYQKVFEHAAELHDIKVRYLCEYCKYRDADKDNVINHVKKKHESKKIRYRSLLCKQRDGYGIESVSAAVPEDDSDNNNRNIVTDKQHKYRFENGLYICNSGCKYHAITEEDIEKHIKNNHVCFKIKAKNDTKNSISVIKKNTTISPQKPVLNCINQENESIPKTVVPELTPSSNIVNEYTARSSVSSASLQSSSTVSITNAQAPIITNITIEMDSQNQPVSNHNMNYTLSQSNTATTTHTELSVESVQENPAPKKQGMIRLVPLTKLLKEDFLPTMPQKSSPSPPVNSSSTKTMMQQQKSRPPSPVNSSSTKTMMQQQNVQAIPSKTIADNNQMASNITYVPMTTISNGNNQVVPNDNYVSVTPINSGATQYTVSPTITSQTITDSNQMVSNVNYAPTTTISNGNNQLVSNNNYVTIAPINSGAATQYTVSPTIQSTDNNQMMSNANINGGSVQYTGSPPIPSQTNNNQMVLNNNYVTITAINSRSVHYTESPTIIQPQNLQKIPSEAIITNNNNQMVNYVPTTSFSNSSIQHTVSPTVIQPQNVQTIPSIINNNNNQMVSNINYIPMTTINTTNTVQYTKTPQLRQQLLRKTPAELLSEVIFNCYHCHNSFWNINDLLFHFKTIHINLQMSTRPFQYYVTKRLRCGCCELAHNFESIKAHHMQAHPNITFSTSTFNDVMQCSECSFQCRQSRNELFDHFANQHPDYMIKTSSSSSINFLTDKLLDQLLKMGQSSTSYKCRYCNHIYQDEILISQHIVKSHKHYDLSYEPYKEISLLYGCKECNVLYNNEKLAIQHLRAYTKPYSCRFCGLPFPDYRTLRLHYQQQHNKNDIEYRYASIQDMLYFYSDMIIVFPNGLTMKKSELKKTIYGNMENFIKLIETVDKEDLQNCGLNLSMGIC